MAVINRGRQEVEEINMMIKINSYMTSVYIKTTFTELRNIKFIVKYNVTDYNGLFGVKLDVNGVTLCQLIRESSEIY